MGCVQFVMVSICKLLINGLNLSQMCLVSNVLVTELSIQLSAH